MDFLKPCSNCKSHKEHYKFKINNVVHYMNICITCCDYLKKEGKYRAFKNKWMYSILNKESIAIKDIKLELVKYIKMTNRIIRLYKNQLKKYKKFANREVIESENRQKRSKSLSKRLKSNNLFRLRTSISNLIRNTIKGKGYKKSNKSENILGCSFDDFKLYLESKFEPWMNWENYGKCKKGELNYGWDIDHIMPVSSANTEDDIIKLNHHTNLQPLCSWTNRYVKRDSI
jgi:hypothetical protein